MVGISSDCNVEEARKDIGQFFTNSTEILAFNQQDTVKFFNSVQEQVKPIANLELINLDNQSDKKVDYKTTLCQVDDPKEDWKMGWVEYLERKIPPAADQSYQSQILLGKNYPSLDENSQAFLSTFNHEFGHIAPHRFSHQQEGGYTDQDALLLMTYNLFMSPMAKLFTRQILPSKFYETSVDFARSEVDAMSLIYGSKPQFEDLEVEYLPGKDMSGKNYYEKHSTQTAYRNTIIGEGKTGILNVDLAQIQQAHKIGIFNVSRSFGECDMFPCSPEKQIKGYENSVMLLEYDSQGEIVKFYNMEGSQDSEIKIMLKTADGQIFNYFNKFKPIALIDETPDQFIDRAFDKDYSLPKINTTSSSIVANTPDETQTSFSSLGTTSTPAPTSTTQDKHQALGTEFESTTPDKFNSSTPPVLTRSSTAKKSSSLSTTSTISSTTTKEATTTQARQQSLGTELSSSKPVPVAISSTTQSRYLSTAIISAAQSIMNATATSPLSAIPTTPQPDPDLIAIENQDEQSQGLSTGAIAGIAAGALAASALIGYGAYRAIQWYKSSNSSQGEQATDIEMTVIQQDQAGSRRPSSQLQPVEVQETLTNQSSQRQ